MTGLFSRELINICYPKACLACSEPLLSREEMICTHCLLALPRSDFHLWKENPVVRKFLGRCPVERGAAFLRFHKWGRVQQILYQLKYQDRPEVGVFMGRLAAHEMREIGFFEGIDRIIPVPLHPRKYKLRGYNQAEVLARGLSDGTGIPLDTHSLQRSHFSDSQTSKGRFERWLNVQTVFALSESPALRQQHVLIVDDVLTTGATMESCMLKLLEVSGLRVSVFTLAAAQN